MQQNCDCSEEILVCRRRNHYHIIHSGHENYKPKRLQSRKQNYIKCCKMLQRKMKMLNRYLLQTFMIIYTRRITNYNKLKNNYVSRRERLGSEEKNRAYFLQNLSSI